jgi:branched-chain amino acid transport system substrate-binding protein
MRTFSTSWWAKLSLIGLILLAMLVTACGGSSSGNGGSTNTSPIKVGVIGPMSGFESFIGPDILKGVQIAVDQINANGGIMGRQV